MNQQALLRWLRGPASFRFRGVVYYLRPLLLMATMWFAMALARVANGALPAGLVMAGAFGSLASLPLCRVGRPLYGTAPPGPAKVALRIVALVLFMLSVQSLLYWLTFGND